MSSTRYIVFYGCDNSGKTTACKNSQKILRGMGYRTKIIHSCGPLSGIEQLEFMIKCLNEKHKDNTIILFDRFPAIEEPIYGPILRNCNKLKNFSLTCEVLLKRIDLFVFCNPPENCILDWGSRKQMDGVKDNAIGLLKRYEKVPIVYPYIKGNMAKYDWTKQGYEGLETILKGRFSK